DCTQYDASGNLVDAGAPCGTGGSFLVQTNGVNNSASGLNAITSTTNSVGLTVTPSNPGTNQEKWEITGGAYTGSAATLAGCVTGALANGSICYWNGSSWATLGGNSGAVGWFTETAAGNPQWSATPSGTLGGGTRGAPLSYTGTTTAGPQN